MHFPAAVYAQDAPRKISLGIMPVYDISGESYGARFCQNLTYMVFQEFKGTTVEPVLLNPGGAYSPDGVEWIADYAQRFGVDGVLISSFPPSERPKNGDWSLGVQTQLYLMNSGQRTPVAVQRTHVDKEYLRKGLYEYAGPLLYGPSRPFAKQPLGKAARRLARAIRDQVMAEAPQVIKEASAAERTYGKGSCSIEFRVSYGYRNAASKSYDVVVNDREESLTAKDGITNLDLSSGAVTLQVVLRDAPYKLPVQHVYLANTYLDCSLPQRTLILDIGAAGEAFVRWRY